MGLYRYISGLGEVWVDSVPPPQNTTNVLWLKLPTSIEQGVQFLVWIDKGDNSGTWQPLVGTKGDTGPSGVVMQNAEPADEDVLVWVDPDEAPGTILEIKNSLGTDPVNAISQKAVTDALDALKEYVDQKVQQNSLYQLWLDAGNSGTVQDFLDSLKGDKGDQGLSAYQVAQINGFTGTEEEWLLLLQN